ncbi:hypothetical protein FQA47_015423 [Oryzias melastigma]|uniref:Uncharacterized protein n=1 Tax=Oryzias melastigma TaxID=30732 RepID=A0A834BKY2_ORYME|nr:hypothetical protein FQA47_015423 [Oryzias melastigma]
MHWFVMGEAGRGGPAQCSGSAPQQQQQLRSCGRKQRRGSAGLRFRSEPQLGFHLQPGSVPGTFRGARRESFPLKAASHRQVWKAKRRPVSMQSGPAGSLPAAARFPPPPTRLAAQTQPLRPRATEPRALPSDAVC